MRKWWLGVFTLPAFFMSLGCFAVARNDNSLSLVWTTGLVWTQVGPADKENESRLGIDIDPEFKKPLADHLSSLLKAKEEVKMSTENK